MAESSFSHIFDRWRVANPFLYFLKSSEYLGMASAVLIFDLGRMPVCDTVVYIRAASGIGFWIGQIGVKSTAPLNLDSPETLANQCGSPP